MLAIFVVFNIHRLFGISGGNQFFLMCYLLSIYCSKVFTDALLGSNFSGSTCLGDVLIFECSVTGGASTVWRGTVFNCSSSNNEIALLHSRFFNDSRSCNGVNIVIGQGLYVEHDQYISQLNVTINNYSALIGRNITCARDDGVVTYVVGYHNLSSNDLTCSNYSDISDTGIARVHTLFLLKF